jgi:hypothetical protein
MGLIHPGRRFRTYRAIADIAAIVITGIGIEYFRVGACPGYSNPVFLTGHRGKVEYDDQVFMFSLTSVTDNGMFHIVAIDPFKTLVTKIMLV